MDLSHVDYCDVFICCLDSHSDGTHSLQRIHWLNLFWWRNKLICLWPEGVHFQLFFFFFGLTIPLNSQIWEGTAKLVERIGEMFHMLCSSTLSILRASAVHRTYRRARRGHCLFTAHVSRHRFRAYMKGTLFRAAVDIKALINKLAMWAQNRCNF